MFIKVSLYYKFLLGFKKTNNFLYIAKLYVLFISDL
jgi:hypothetical protein